MGEPDAIGEAVSGTMLGRSVEPKAGEVGVDGHTHELTCLNCGSALQGDYCHACGQRAHVHRTVTAFAHDLLHGVLHLDGKVWRTLPMLVWRPGQLTRRYIDGERTKFVSPMALFLFSVFLMFVVFTALGGPFDVQSGPLPQTQEVRADRLAVQEPGPTVIASGQTARGTRGRLTVRRTGVEVIDRALAKAETNPELLLYKLQNNAYKFSWLLIPLSVPLVWILFLHRRRYREFRAYDHTVFVTYSIAFMTLGLVALTFLRLAGVTEAVIGLAILIVPPIHIYRQLRENYSLSRLSALWRTAVLLICATISAALFLGLLTVIGVLG